MRDFGDPALDAIEAGQALSVGAVSILTSPTPVRIWGGFGEITVGGNLFVGIGDRGLVSAVSTAVGGAEQALTLELSGVDATALSLFDMTSLRGVPVIVYRLIFDASGRTLLAAPVFARGKLDQVSRDDQMGGTAILRAQVETAARGLGRSGGRMRSDADQRLITADDDGLRGVSYAGQTTIYWGGKIPADAKAAFGAQPAGGGGVGGVGGFDLAL